MHGFKAATGVWLAIVALLAFVASGTPVLSAPDDERPVVYSVYARDEGLTIQLRVSYCDNTPPFFARYRHIFRIFDSDGNLVARRTTTRTSAIRCVNRGVVWLDDFESGAYYAQFEVRNLDNGAWIRTKARRFLIV